MVHVSICLQANLKSWLTKTVQKKLQASEISPTIMPIILLVMVLRRWTAHTSKPFSPCAYILTCPFKKRSQNLLVQHFGQIYSWFPEDTFAITLDASKTWVDPNGPEHMVSGWRVDSCWVSVGCPWVCSLSPTLGFQWPLLHRKKNNKCTSQSFFSAHLIDAFPHCRHGRNLRSRCGPFMSNFPLTLLFWPFSMNSRCLTG